MADYCSDCGRPKMYCSCKSLSAVFPTKSLVIKGERCTSCGRDTSQPNLLPPSISRFCEKEQPSPGNAICRQCGGLGAGLLHGI